MRFLEYKFPRTGFPKPFGRGSIGFDFRHVTLSPLIKNFFSFTEAVFLSDYR